MEQDPYFGRPEVSNSDLSALKDLLYPHAEYGDKSKAYAFGTLLDNLITEPDKVDLFNLKVQYQDYPYTQDDFDLALKMKRAYMKDDFCRMINDAADFQAITIVPDFKIDYLGFEFSLPARCKWDLLVPEWNMGGDIKSTAAETQSQFEAACEHFDYFRSRAWYMDLAGTDKDMLIGISKKNCKIFKIAINRGDALYEKGKEAYQELAFKYWMFFDGIKLTA